MSDGPVATLIREKLALALAPTEISLVDESWKHAGHHHEGGIDAKDGGETHFQLRIVSAAFEGMNRVARHRAVTAVIQTEMKGPVHALSLEAVTPAEAAGT